MSKQKSSRSNGKNYGKRKYLRSVGVSSSRELSQSVAEIGLSVFRSPEDQERLFEVQNEFINLCSEITHIPRGAMGSRPMALSQLMMHEVFGNKKVFEEIEAQEAVNHIYDSVGSLRRQTTVALGNLGLFGSRNASFAIVGVAVHEDEMARINIERRQIINALEDIANPGHDYEFQWLQRQIPHISLGKIDGKYIDEYKNTIRPALTDQMPKEVQLKRATIYKPTGF